MVYSFEYILVFFLNFRSNGIQQLFEFVKTQCFDASVYVKENSSDIKQFSTFHDMIAYNDYIAEQTFYELGGKFSF